MRSAIVRVHDVDVGRLDADDDENYVFTFTQDWCADAQRPMLGQIFEDRRPRSFETSGLPWWFAHVLPQGPLRELIAKETGVETNDGFELLCRLGADLPGAVTVRPTSGTLRQPTKAVAVKPDSPTEPREGLRFSLAGMQWKLSVREDDKGLTVPVSGETGSFIAKFHDLRFAELPRIEAATLTWAKAAGLHVEDFRLADVDEFDDLPKSIPTGDGTVLLARRFDRTPEARVHMEDFGQIIGRTPGRAQFVGRFEEIAAILAQIAPGDLERFVHQLVFCILAGNTDAHLKNWSVIYPDRRSAELSPAYDLVATILFVPPLDDEMALDLNRSRKFEDVSISSFAPMAKVCDIDEKQMSGWVAKAIAKTGTAWLGDDYGFTTAERDRIGEHMRRIPLANETSDKYASPPHRPRS